MSSTQPTDTDDVEHTAGESAPTGIARCAELATQTEPYTVNGVAIGADEVTRGANGAKFWPAEALRPAAQSLVGVPLTKNHDDKTVESVVGEVVDAGFEPGVGVVFEAEVDDEELATKIARGRLDVSVHALHSDGGRTDDGELIVEDVRFLDLSVVPRGGSPSNYVEAGESPSEVLASLSVGEVADILADDGADSTTTESMTDETTDEIEQDDETLAEADSSSAGDAEEAELAMDAGALVQWDSGGGNAHGAIVSSMTEGCFNDRIDGDVEVCANPEDDDPAHLIEIHQENSDGAWEPTGTMVGHLESTLSEWEPDAEVLEEPMDAEESESNADETTVEDDTAELREELESLRAENQELRNELESVRLEYAEQLSEGSPFEAAELASKFTFGELQSKFEEAEASLVPDDDTESEATPAPRTGGTTEGELSTSETQSDAEIAELESKIEQYDEMGWDAAKADAEARLAELRA